jgi:hypothetical protein
MVKRGAPKQTEVRQSARYPEDVAAGARLGWLGALGVGRVAILRDNTFTFTRTHVNDEPWLLKAHATPSFRKRYFLRRWSLKHRRGSKSRFLKLNLRTWLHLHIYRICVLSA